MTPGDRVWSRDEADQGTVTNVHGPGTCRLEGCGGTRVTVRWPDGHITYPCARAIEARPQGGWKLA